MLISKTVKTRWNAKTKKYYESKGYIFTKMGDELEIKVEDLKDNSNELVKFKCDYCNKDFDRKWCYHTRNLKRSNFILKDCCDSPTCMSQKIEESNMTNFGVKSKMCLDEYHEKGKITCIEKYGVDSYTKTNDFKEKYKNTMLDKYGVENSFQLDDVKEKIKLHNLKEYGVESFSQSDEFKNRYEETMIKKYGVKNTFEVPEFYEKYKQTMIDKYGTEHALKNKKIYNKMIIDNLEKHGVENISQLEEVKNKKAKSFYKNGTVATSKQQRYLHMLLGGKLNYSQNTPSLDIAFPEEMIYVEYDGSGHTLSVKNGRMTKENFEDKERRRYYYLKNLGWKAIKINSPYDYLPTDEVILNEIERAKEWFNIGGKGHSHYIINIGNKVNDEKYGKLRKIKEKDLEQAM